MMRQELCKTQNNLFTDFEHVKLDSVEERQLCKNPSVRYKIEKISE